MVKNNAVLATVMFALVVSVASVSFTFYQLYENNRAKHIDSIFAKHALINQVYHSYINKQISQPVFEANLAFYDLEEVNKEGLSTTIIRQGKVLKSDASSDEVVGHYSLTDSSFEMHSPQQIITSMIEYQDNIYFWVESSRHNALLFDRGLTPYHPVNLMSAYVTLISILSIAFILIIYRLHPLRRLRKQIARFGEGDMGVRFGIDGSDEIALIANELESTQNKIRSLLESRTLFLRNIMHELKTPIAKGRIVATMLSDEKQRGRFEGIFERLESLIGEFALIEEITSGNQYHEKKEYRLVDIIDGAIDMAMVEYDAVERSIDSAIKIEADYRLFVTAAKNLIDNAIKYSPEKKMNIWMEEGEIVFANVGEPLKKPLNYYIEPFTKEHPTKDSFGLGLYIVDAILKEHDYVLAYERRENTNCFICVPVKSKRK